MGGPSDFWEAEAHRVTRLYERADAIAVALAGTTTAGVPLADELSERVCEPLRQAARLAETKFHGPTAPLSTQLAQAWLLAGYALAQWADLAHLVSTEADRAEEVRQLAAFLAAAPVEGAGSQLKEHLRAGAAILTRLADELPRRGSSLTPAAARFRATVRAIPRLNPLLAVRDGYRAIRQWMSAPSPGVPPAAPPGITPEVAARLLAAIGLLTATDQNPTRLDAATRTRLEEAATEVANPTEIAVDWDGIGEAGVSYHDDPDGPRVQKAGLIVRMEGVVVWSRPALVRRPPPPPPRIRVVLEGEVAAGGELAEVARQLLNGLPREDITEGWWKGLSPERKGDWWWLVQQAARQNAGVLQALAEARVCATPVADAPNPPGPWFVTAAPPGTPTTGPAVAVAFPDGTQVGPAVWLRLNPTRPGARALVRGLDGCRPLLHRLRAADPDWPGWAEYNDAMWALAVGRPADAAAEAEVGYRAFRAVLRRVEETRDRPPPLSDAYLDLGRRLYAVLTRDMGVTLPLRLGDDLRAAPLTGPPGDAADVEWVGGPDPVGTVLAFELPDGKLKTRLKVAVGPGNDGLLRWLALPAPRPAVLAEFAQVVQAAPWDARPADRLAAGLAKVAAWAAGDTPDARDWWAVAPPDDPWWRELVRAGVVKAYPTLGAADAVEWPDGAAPAGKTQWEFSPRVPLRGLIRDARFGPTADRAGGRFSLGQREGAADALLAAERLLAADPGNDAAERVWADEVAAALGHPRPPAVEAVADRLPSAPAAVVEAAREWLDARGYELIVPEPSDADPEYDEPGSTRTGPVVRYGFAGPNGHSRRGVAVGSAGPAPPGYAELRRELQRLGEAELVARLGEWPAAGARDELEALAQAFYSAFYDRCGGDPPARPGWEQAVALLARLMLETFGWRQFRVAHRRERPEREIEYDRDVGRGNDIVRRTLRPGLETAAGVRMVSTRVTFGGDA